VRATQARPSGPAVFAAGDVQDYDLPPAVTSAGAAHRGASDAREVRTGCTASADPGAPDHAQTPSRGLPDEESPVPRAVRAPSRSPAARVCDAASLARSGPILALRATKPIAETSRPMSGTHHETGQDRRIWRRWPRRSAQVNAALVVRRRRPHGLTGSRRGCRSSSFWEGA